jgi:two-component system LytT family response regulator
VRATRDECGPQAIIVTQKPDHALAAYAAGAVDYLLKPVPTARFAESLERARTRTNGPVLPHRRGAPGASPTILVGEKERRLYPLAPAKIDYVESDGNYVMFRTANADYISRDSIKRLAMLLADEGFLRIERSLLLNMRAVSFVEPAGHGTYAFTLTSGTVLQSSATYRDEILKVMPLVRTIKATLPIGSSVRA